jgi:predicted nucleotidyltransferase component of viral defense system
MTRADKRDLAASIKQRLLNLARETSQDFQALLTRYALERLLYRVGRSPYRDRLLLKGAFLFVAWQDDTHRPTRDLDLLSSGEADVDELERVFRDLIEVNVEADGLEFDATTVKGELIRHDDPYHGVRLHLRATLGKARIPLQVDVGFGDAIVPDPVELEFPTLLDLPHPWVRAYPVEAVIAEKAEAMVRLGLINSRLKDFYDLWRIASKRTLDGATLSRALTSTFHRRHTQIPHGDPPGLTAAFVADAARCRQWSALVRTYDPGGFDPELQTVLELLRQFLGPVLQAIRDGGRLELTWIPGRGWVPRGDG